MPQAIFKRANELIAGQYLLGQYSWSREMRIVDIRATFDAGTGGDTTIQLEINGVLQTDYTVTITPGSNSQVLDVGSGIVVPATYRVRWKVITDSSNSQAALDTSIVMRVVVNSFAGDLVPNDTFKVRYVDGTERVDLFTYNPTTHTFSEITSGLSTGRVTLASDGSSIYIDGDLAFLVTESGVGQVAGQWIDDAQAVIGSTDKRLEFLINRVRVAELSVDSGFKVKALTEAAPTDATTVFAFLQGDVVRAVLDRNGLTCNTLAEI